MLTVTDNAKKRLKEIVSAKVNNPQDCLRLITSGPAGQYGFSIDREMPGDQIVEHKGTKVLLVEGQLADRLEGLTLDIEDTVNGPDLAISQKKQS